MGVKKTLSISAVDDVLHYMNNTSLYLYDMSSNDTPRLIHFRCKIIPA